MSKFRRLLAVCVAVALTPVALLAQEPATISGRVTRDTGAPVASAVVRLNAFNVGTITGEDGTYRLVVPASRIRAGQQVQITASQVGLASQSRTITLAPGASLAQNFQLGVDPLQLEAIVVTGAGTESRAERLGTARASVSGESVTRANETNVITALSGKVANIQTMQSSGEAGSSTAIRIRGTKTFTGTGEPLIVVDGVPVSNTTYSTSRGLNGSSGSGSALSGTVATNRAADINPEDIESVEILKGPAATSIYGASAGAGGAILITTKRGKTGRTTYTMRSSLQLDEVTKTLPMQQRFGVGTGGTSTACTAVNCSLPTGGFFSWGPELPSGTPTYDHSAELYETGSIFDNTVSVSGGSERTTFYLSGGAVVQDGYIVGNQDDYKRYTARLNGTHQLRENLTLGGNVSYAQTAASYVPRGNSVNGLLLGALRTPPEFNNQEYLVNGLHRSYRFPNPGAGSELMNRGFDNPFYALYEGQNTQDVGRVFGNVNAAWQALNWLRVNYTLGADYYGDDRLEGRPYQSSGSPTAGTVTRWQFSERIIDHNLLATGEYALGSSITGAVTAGQNLNETRFRQVYVVGNSLIAPTPLKLENTTDRAIPTDDEQRRRLEGYFVQGTMDIGDQLFLLASLRNDGASTFGRNYQRAWYPKGSVAWSVTRTLGVPENILTFGKLRAAYGQSGNPPAVYQLQDIYTTSTIADFSPGSELQPIIGGQAALYTNSIRGNPDLRPERISELEAGMDVSLLQGRADMSVTYYNSDSRDVILNVPLASSTGYFSQPANAGHIKNRGWEATVNLRPYTRDNLAFELGFNWARNRNQVLSLGEGNTAPVPYPFAAASFTGSSTFAEVGQPLGVFRGQDFIRCGQSADKVLVGSTVIDVAAACAGAPKGALYIAASGLPIADPDIRVIGDPNPDWTGGMNADLRIRGVRVSAFLETRQGGQTLNMTKSSLYQYGTHKDTEIRGQRVVFGRDWLQSPGIVGPGANTEVVIGQTWFSGLGGVSGPRAPFMEDASITRLREVSVAYTFDQPSVRRATGLGSVDVRVSGRNLYNWTDYTGYDPEPSVGGAVLANRGIDWFVNPLSRAWVVSVTLTR